MQSWLRRACARALTIVVLSVGLLVALSAEASAHAELVETNPANGAHLDRPPQEVVLRFSEAVNPVRGGFSLLDDTGATVSKPAATADATRIRLPLPSSLADGVYVVNWRVVSTDSHPIFGAFVFSAGDKQAAPLADAGAQSGSDSSVEAVFWLFRLLSFASLALLVGGAFFVVVCWPAGRSNQRVGRLLKIAWSTAVVSAGATLLLQGPNVAGMSLGGVADLALLGDTVQTGFGISLLARLALLGLAGLLLMRLKTVSRKQIAVVLGLGFALALTWSGTGHAASGGLSALTMVTDAAHLTAGAVWLGGVAVLAGCALGTVAQQEDDVVVAVSRFSRTAGVTVAVLGATGLVQASLKLVEYGPGTEYFSVLVFKVAVFGLLLWIASFSRSYVRNRLLAPAAAGKAARRRQERRGTLSLLRRSVGWEAGMAAVVLGLTAALVSIPPGGHDHGPDVAVAAQTGPFLEAFALSGESDVQVWVDPARTGNNQIVLNVRDGHGINQDVSEVRAELQLPEGNLGPLPVSLSKAGPGQFVADDVIVPVAGTWQLNLRIRLTEFDSKAMDVRIPMR